MEVWTEIIHENIADVHVGQSDILVDIGGATGEQVREVERYLEERRVWEHCRDELQELNKEVRAQECARGRLEAAGYDPSEVPL